MTELAFTFSCRGEELVGVIHDPNPSTAGASDVGLLIVVGGDQYRVGAHRQYVTMARRLSAGGFAVMRFDDRGKGDAEGRHVSYEEVQHDAIAAIEEFHRHCPHLNRVVLWGLCGAVTTLLLAERLPASVAGLILVNPWVRTEEGEARAYLKHYYRERLFDKDLWRKIARGEFSILGSARSALNLILRVLRGGGEEAQAEAPLPERMAEGFARFTGEVLVILSGRDLTAQEFEEEAARSGKWRDLLKSERVAIRKLAAADHTFSARACEEQLELWTLDWLKALARRS